ncbi:MAG: family 16 glycoside hydrolase [Akkermansiaceae bacterium]
MSRFSLLLALTFTLTPLLRADTPGELLFTDDFERSETQELEDEPGKGWGTNSKQRAKGNKQVDLRDGAMHIYIHDQADHGVSVTHPAVFTDGSVSLRFMLEDAKDNLGLNFADLDFKEVHAGHLFVVEINPKKVQCLDLKTGKMRLDIFKARLAKTPLTAKQESALKGKERSFPLPLQVGKWHDLLVQITGDEITVTVNGAEAGRFQSPGIAHPTKKMLRLSVPRNAVLDDVEIRRLK